MFGLEFREAIDAQVDCPAAFAALALARAGLNGLAEGQRVRMQVGQGRKGLEAQTIELLD